MHVLFQTIPLLAQALSGGSFVRMIKLCVQLWYFAFTRKTFAHLNDFPITGLYLGQRLTFYLRFVMDLAVLREIFIEGEYDWCPLPEPKVIIDLGAHFGDTALFYHARFPQAKIIAVEPSPDNFARLLKHTANIPNIVPVQAAVGAVDGEVQLHLMPSSLGHSVMDRKESSTTVSVRQVSLASLFAAQGVAKADLIKFDIEGAEFGLFEHVRPEQLASLYVGEVHPDLATIPSDFLGSFTAFSVETVPLNRGRFIIKASAK